MAFRRHLTRFRRAQHGAVAIETALSISVLVLALAGLMGIVQSVYTTDQLGRAARAAARTIALLPDAPASQTALAARACEAIRRELHLDPDFDCAAQWAIAIDSYPTPEALLAGTAVGEAAPGGGNGDMVLVRIGWSRVSSPLGWLAPDANADEGAGSPPVSMAVMGVARNERAEDEG